MIICKLIDWWNKVMPSYNIGACECCGAEEVQYCPPTSNCVIWNFTGFETGDFTESNFTSGVPVNVSYVTTGTDWVGESNTYKLLINYPTSWSDRYYRLPLGYSGNAIAAATLFEPHSYTRIYFKFDAIPSANMDIASLQGNTTLWKLILTSSGKLNIKDATGTLVGTGTTTLSVDTWYRFEIYWSYSAPSPSFIYKINGTTEGAGSHTDPFPTTTNVTVVNLGSFVDPGLSSAVNVYYDDVACGKTDWIGPGHVKVLTITGNGFYDGTGVWTDTNNGYDDVEEIPPDDTTTYIEHFYSTAYDVTKSWLFVPQTFAQAGITDTGVNAVKLVGRAKTKGVVDSTEVCSFIGRYAGVNYVLNWTTYSNSIYTGGVYVWPFETGTTRWTASTIAGIQLGANARSVSGPTTYGIHVTHYSVMVDMAWYAIPASYECSDCCEETGVPSTLTLTVNTVSGFTCLTAAQTISLTNEGDGIWDIDMACDIGILRFAMNCTGGVWQLTMLCDGVPEVDTDTVFSCSPFSADFSITTSTSQVCHSSGATLTCTVTE